ncbi:hypothetical protein BDZ94DRAFT_1276997 [Collybia nuda]|uniref:Rhodanese domain-containing protein n=1 Tax=Collybia nuda TaxID=64659 RepID=A0A9P6CCA7_9AGAR|nr:hypothetical protein BDZ94DRAFT_1276997 [Collybia nuda]
MIKANSSRSYGPSDVGNIEGSSAHLVPASPGAGAPHRTLDDIREQVAQEVAVRAITNAKTVDGVRIGVTFTFSKSNEEEFLTRVADVIQHQLVLAEHLFVVATTGGLAAEANPMMICGSSIEFVQRAILLASSKFIGRIKPVVVEETLWIVFVEDIGTSTYDEVALWDVVSKSTRAPIDPLEPPPLSRGIDQILSDVRAKIQRITPLQAYEELRESRVGAPTFLVDIRPAAQREMHGGIHGSLIIERNVLEWRFDPRSESRLAIVDRYDLRVIIFCQEGYTSSLAAFALQELGLLNATDIIGGYQAWINAGLPTDVTQPRSLVSLAGSIV